MKMDIPKQESQNVEFKRSLILENDIIISCVALSNSEGGHLYIGINDDGSITGADIGRNTMENLAKRLSELITPKIYPKIEVLEIGGKKIIVVELKDSLTKPHFFKGVAYKRVGKTNQKVDPQELEIMFIKKHSEKIRFDSQVSSFGLNSIDEGRVKDFFERAKMAKRLKDEYGGIEHTLKNLGLLDEHGKVLNAAIILFGKNPSAAFPQYGYRCAVVSGGQFTDFKFYNDNMFTLIENVYDFAMMHIPKKIRIERTKRIEEPLIPADAIREAIINSIIHRDYYSSASNYLSVSRDGIEINNPGALPVSLKIADLFEKHRSIPWNPHLAKAAFMADYIEQWGTGTRKIVTLMRETGLEDPIFEEKQDFFTVKLYSLAPNLNERMQWALDFVKDKGEIRSKDIAGKFNVTKRTALTDLDGLVEKGFVNKKGKKKGAYYSTK